MFDCRTNRTPIERLGSIGFDWFLVQFRSISYAGRPVADSGLVKSSNLSYTWPSRGSLRCRDGDSCKEKVKKATGRIFDRLKMRMFSRIRNHDFSRKPQHGVATLLRYCFEWLQRCSNIARLCCGVSSPITLP